ncbi:hypothetical protein BLNAU_9243 [Blattamonas nauphoetae]|uniref:Uncharacterized protein n=1 Tax=Blattamonas nauphoetae TaxID=2049346 RepID=A0ABQ9XWL9_9EUKA|nr:hypothetical protein BLNAU_9243 [Blattamonas nauphoetae]
MSLIQGIHDVKKVFERTNQNALDLRNVKNARYGSSLSDGWGRKESEKKEEPTEQVEEEERERREGEATSDRRGEGEGDEARRRHFE